MVNPTLFGMVLARPFIIMAVVMMFTFMPALPFEGKEKKEREE